MANGYSPKDVKLENLEPISGIVTATAISQDVGLSAQGALHMRVDLQVTAATVVGSITAKLQHRAPNGSFIDLAGANASIVITAAGTFSMTQAVERAADQANMPLRKQLRVVLTTTNAGDAVTIGNVWLYQPL
jgi:hypothetical protein